MPERILGLDIGLSSIKVVLLSRGLRGGYRVLDFRRIDTAEAGGPEEALQRLFADKTFHGAVCVTALPAGLLSFRHISLPFREDRKIRQTLAFALEPLIQTPLEELFIDYTQTARSEKAEIFAALAPRTLVEQRIALLAPHVRETAVIDISAVSLTLRLMRDKDAPETALLLDVGARDTTAVFAGRGKIFHIRHFPFGGETATRAVASALGCDLVQAEAKKRSGGLSPEAATALAASCASFCGEVVNTRTSLLWQGALPGNPELILLTGGGAKTPGLEAALAQCLGTPVRQADLLAEGGIEMDQGKRPSWDSVVLDQALALAARPMAKGNGFNFRQLAIEARAGYGKFRERLKWGAMVAALILILAIIDMGMDDYGARLRLASLKQNMAAEFKKGYPEATRIVDPVAQLRGKIAEERKVASGLADVTAEATVLDLLKEISGFAPENLLLASFTLDGDVIGLKGEARNFDAVDVFKKAFANSKYFKTVTIGSTNLTKQGGVEFDLKVTLKK